MDEKIFDGEFFKNLNALKLNMNIPLDKGMSGGRKSRAKGSSVEFSDFREYMYGDDIRRIDWNAYGRMDRFFVKLFMEEKEGVFRIFVDGSKSMDFGLLNKSIHGRRIAAAAAYVVLNHLDRVYLGTMGSGGILMSKGMTGRQSFHKVMDQLENMKFEGIVDLKKVIKSSAFPSRGMTIVISDFYESAQDLEEVVKYLAYKKQEVVLIQVLSREELSPRGEGTLNLIDSETSKDLKVTMTYSTLNQYEKTLSGFLDQIRVICNKYGAKHILAPTDKPMGGVLYELC